MYLILTLNHIYPDYDFSQLRSNNFKKENGFSRAEEVIDSYLLEVSKVSQFTDLQNKSVKLTETGGTACRAGRHLPTACATHQMPPIRRRKA